jgi:hypothetical protein
MSSLQLEDNIVKSEVTLGPNDPNGEVKGKKGFQPMLGSNEHHGEEGQAVNAVGYF